MAKTTFKTVGLRPTTAKFLTDLANELNKRANGIVDIKLSTGLDVLAKKTTVAELANLISNNKTSTPSAPKKVKARKTRVKRKLVRTDPKLLNSLYEKLVSNNSVNVNIGTKQASKKVATALYNKAYLSNLQVSSKRAGKGKGFIVEIVKKTA